MREDVREDVKMSRCERRCEDEKMFYRPPLLEEPCAQTLSGKNNRAKGVTLKTTDIKIIMYVCTPQKIKYLDFTGLIKFLVVETVSQFLSYLNPLSNPF